MRAGGEEYEEEAMSILEVRGYSLDYATPAGLVRALDAIDLTIVRGEVLGLVGESGSGKTSLAWAIMRHLPTGVREQGSISLTSRSLMTASDAEIAAMRGRRIGMSSDRRRSSPPDAGPAARRGAAAPSRADAPAG